MLISRTPFRISFFGGGTDYPKWYIKNGGAILSTSINKYCYITCRNLPKFFEYKNRIVYSKIENTNTYKEIQHPVVRETLKWMNINNISIHHEGDLPANCGLGSSSAFTVGLLNSLYNLQDHKVNTLKLIKDAIYIEKDALNESVGIQDQIAVAQGGMNKIKINKDGSFFSEKINLSDKKRQILESRLMMFYTEISRYSSSIASNTIERIYDHEDNYMALADMVEKGFRIIKGNRSLDDLGFLLDEAWRIKKQLSPLISSPVIDEIYNKAIKAGALGGKILGAGGGGFILFYALESKQEMIKEALKDLLYVPFRFEDQGSKIIYNSNCTYYKS